MKPVLKIDWATHEAAKYACENWHYSKCMPSYKTVKIGAWEDTRFVGVVIFSMGAAPNAHCPYKIQPREICELTRVAFRNHKTPISRILSICLKFLKAQSSGLKLIVSYADPEQGHHGGIYQAGGWIYQEVTTPCRQFEFVKTGKRVHSKTICTGRRGYATNLQNRGVIRSVMLIKHKYLMPLDSEMRKQILPLSRPYPKRAQSIENDAAGIQPDQGGANPTCALQSSIE